MGIRYKTLSSRSAALLQNFSSLNRQAFTLKDAADVFVNSSRDAVKKLLRDMVKRGLLLRIRDGVYWIIPYEQDAETYFPNWHIMAPYLVGKADFYIGYYSALEIHSLITQPSLVERIVVNKQVKPTELLVKEVKFRFIYHNPEHFFGAKQVWIDSFNKVWCSDLEKTFVDCLYKPDYAGGITEIAKALYKARTSIDYAKLYDYCKRFGAQSVIKRLGFLMDLLEIDTPVLSTLQQLITKSTILLEPSYEKKGRVDSKWSVQLNIDAGDITSPIFN